MVKRRLKSEESKISKLIEDIDDDIPWIKKDIAVAGKKQDREGLESLAEQIVRLRRNRRELVKYRKYIDGLLIQTQSFQMNSLTNNVTETLLGCLDAMPNMTNHEERRNNMMEFQKQMSSMKMATEVLGDFLNEDEEEAENDELSDDIKEIVDEALSNASYSIMDKLPNVSLTQPRNTNNNNNNNNNNSIKPVSTNPHNILQEIDKYTKT